MAKIDEKWDRILKKIQLILEKNNKLEIDNLEFIEINNKLTSEIDALKKQHEQLKEQIQYIKAAKEVHLSEKERAETKQQLKVYIEEIGDCLAKLIN